jgi:hypothetical protein
VEPDSALVRPIAFPQVGEVAGTDHWEKETKIEKRRVKLKKTIMVLNHGL